LDMRDVRSWDEAKVSGWWIDLAELKPNFESKKVLGLYFVGEAIDITGKTGWYNLQWAWSSAYVCGSSIN
jgi:predicted flavoprotein YhiN